MSHYEDDENGQYLIDEGVSLTPDESMVREQESTEDALDLMVGFSHAYVYKIVSSSILLPVFQKAMADSAVQAAVEDTIGMSMEDIRREFPEDVSDDILYGNVLSAYLFNFIPTGYSDDVELSSAVAVSEAPTLTSALNQIHDMSDDITQFDLIVVDESGEGSLLGGALILFDSEQDAFQVDNPGVVDVIENSMLANYRLIVRGLSEQENKVFIGSWLHDGESMTGQDAQDTQRLFEDDYSMVFMSVDTQSIL